jgi:aspartate carbamoyltransferase catalytic subunit
VGYTGDVPPLRHLVGLRDLPAEAIRGLLDRAVVLRQRVREEGRLDVLAGHSIGLVFLEPSTRTRFSFEMAAKNLGADVLSMSAEGSSTTKGETLWDTAKTLRSHGADAFVLRHKCVGSPHQLARRVDVPVINAGDGINEHPTQALLDALTLIDRFGSLEGLTVGIVGDLRHSRVTRSNAFLLPRLGAKVLLAGPGPLCPDAMTALSPGVEVRHTLDDVLKDADVVMMLRIQRERMAPGMLPSDGEYAALWGLDARRLARARPNVVVMHPGPMNRGVEIASDVADGPGSVIFQQKANGVAVRMAVLATVLEAA